jgi:hypothetical protein
MLAEQTAALAGAAPPVGTPAKISRALTALLLFVAICLGNVTFFPVNPQRSDFVPAKISSKGRAQRAADFFYGAENPSLIFLGTSLIFRASFECDKKFENLAIPTDDFEAWEFKRKHVECQYLERMLKHTFGKSLSAFEFGIPAAMVSDYREFTSKLSLFSKNPKVLICTLAPRDFFDNVYKDPKDTTGWEQISTCYPTASWLQHPMAAWFYLTRQCAPILFLDQKVDAIKSRAFTYRYNFEQSSRDHLLALLHQSTLPSTMAPTQAKQSAIETTHSYPDLDCYRFTYNPPDFGEFDRNVDQLRMLVKDCRKNGRLLVLIDMPVTPENRNQMMPEALALYRKTIREIAGTYKTKLIVPEEGTAYDASDFEDSVHLTAPGGDKFFRFVVKSLSETPEIRASLTQ